MPYTKTPEHLAAMAEGRRRAAQARREAIVRGELPPSNRIRPGREAVSAQSEEFKKAVEAAVAEKLPAMLVAVAAANNSAAAEKPEAFAAALALQLAKFTGQGVGKTYIDPEEIEKRNVASKKMLALLEEFRSRGTLPAYRVIAKTQLVLEGFGPTLIEPYYQGVDRIPRETEIDYAFVPNLAMAPINDAARRVYALFETAIGAELPEVKDAENLAPGPTSPMARGAPQLGEQVLTRSGTVVRGEAARAIMRNTQASQGFGMPEMVGPQQAAVIRRGDDPVLRKRQVLGTLTDPIEMS